MEYEYQICPSCEGSGEGDYDGQRCWRCRGKGSAMVKVENVETETEELLTEECE